MRFDSQKPLLALRFGEIPRRKAWGFVIRFFKTFEVLVFKLLQSLDLYRPRKSIVGIPSLATREFLTLQACVYNGTQEEVLGFRPRRLLHRIIKGLPDLEAFERVHFEVGTGNSAFTRESSTDTRGFVSIALPWKGLQEGSRFTFPRIQPAGVETLVGRISLGDYEVLSAPIFSLTPAVKWVVISDIDDTIKDTKIADTVSFKGIIRSLFRGHYYKYDPIVGMAELYQELAANGALIVYLTSTPFQLAPFLLKFLRQCHFPEGPVFPRWLRYGRFGHKWRTLSRVLGSVDAQRCFLVGDSGEQDLQIYRRIYETSPLNDSVEKILIRHVPGTPMQKQLHEREAFYHDIQELRSLLEPILGAGAPSPPVVK